MFGAGNASLFEDTSEWFTAAKNGDDEAIARLLLKCPELATKCDVAGDTALHFAAKGGHDKVVAQVLKAHIDLVRTTNFTKRVALHVAAEEGHEQVVARLLAAGPLARGVATLDGVNALHFAASSGNDKVVALILAACPSLITSATTLGWTALSYAALKGHEKVFAQLLTLCPQLVALDPAVLICAAQSGHEGLVTQILALCPEKISEVGVDGWTALKWAVRRGHEKVAERLLALRPEEVFEVRDNHTLLHAATRQCSREFVEKVWRMNPQALRVIDDQLGSTPFHFAVMFGRIELIELFQWSLTIDEMVSAFTRQGVNSEELLRAVVEEQCECLMERLSRDVAAMVLEYLGFEPAHKRARNVDPLPLES